MIFGTQQAQRVSKAVAQQWYLSELQDPLRPAVNQKDFSALIAVLLFQWLSQRAILGNSGLP